MNAAKWVGAALSVLLLTWTAFNAGFDYGADAGACIAFTMATEIPAQENAFCESAKPVAGQPIQTARDAWLWLHNDKVSHP